MLVAAVALVAVGSACSSGGGTVRVAAAADLQFALQSVIEDFHRNYPAIKIEPVYGSSGDFYSQLANGAPFDVFLSADMSYPRKLVQSRIADVNSLVIYSVGHIVLWTPKNSPLDVEKTQTGTLTLDSVHKIAIANPEHAPYGRAAEQYLRSQGIYEKVQPKLVLGESIAQTLQFVESGSADVGIVALSEAMSPPIRDKGRYYVIPEDTYQAIEQGAIVLTHAKNQQAAHQFVSYLLTPGARRALGQFGFSMPQQ